MGGFFGPSAPAQAASGGGGGLPGFKSFDSPAGVSNDVTPPLGFTGSGRLYVLLPNGAATWTGLLAGADGDELLIINGDAVNVLTLDALNAGSAGANQFIAPDNLALPPGDSVLAVYTAQSIDKWILR